MTQERMKIDKVMTVAVHNGLMRAVAEKGDEKALVTLQTIERCMWQNGVETFVPVSMVVSALIKKSIIKYRQLPNGKLIYGFTQFALDKMKEKAKVEQEKKERGA